MTGNDTTSIIFPLLNPNTSLAFLPPSLAAQLEATRYLSIAALAVFVWDMLSNAVKDYCLVTRHKITLPTIIYFISRFTSLAHITATTLFHVAPISSCQKLPIVIGSCWAVAIPATSLLFFFRVKAVFDGKRGIVAIFALLWLVNLAGSLTVPFALSGGNIGSTKRCIPTAVKPFSSAGIIATACYDTLIFIAISWRIIKQTATGHKIRSFFAGDSLPYISRELLRGGQQYYLFTVGGNIVIMAVLLSSSTPPLLRDMFPVLNMALENSMACRVFRKIKLGRVKLGRAKTGAEDRDNSLPVSNVQPPDPKRSFGGKEMTALQPMCTPAVEITRTVTVEYFSGGITTSESSS
ncbi:hypothetical protein BU17DRAFT_40792 [Hysterangium stoloniferum]|nr:hypothetical protein BU17DRAFT_40792 [Hysterangium stoloniferum]